LKISSDGKVVMSDYGMSMPMPVNVKRAGCVWKNDGLICGGEEIGKWSEEHGWHNMCESHEAERVARFWDAKFVMLDRFENGLGA
jgi:hypothetical protein